MKYLPGAAVIVLMLMASAARADLLDATDRGPSVHARDLSEAMLRQRPGARSLPTPDQLGSFKGFTAEASLLRRKRNTARPGELWDFAPPNDPIADLIRTESNGRRVSVQQYAGASPTAAFEKLLGSDAAADELVVPRDVHARMEAAVREAEAIHRRPVTPEWDRTTAIRQIRRRVEGVGLRVYEDMRLGLETKVGRRYLGTLGTDEITRTMAKVRPDTLTSSQVQRSAMLGLLDLSAETALGRFTRSLGLANANGVDAVATLLAERKQLYRSRGFTHWQAARKASNWLRFTEAPRIMSDLAHARQLATAAGAPESRLAEINRRPPTGTIAERSLAIQNDLRAASRRASLRQHGTGQAAAAVFILIGAGLDLALSDDELDDWLRSDRALEWGVRGGMAAGIVAASVQTDRLLAQAAVGSVGKAAAQTSGTRIAPALGGTAGRRVVVVGGLAGGLFIAGESLIQVYGHGRSFAEVSGQFYESVAVMAVSEGAGIAVAKLVGASSLGGPLAIGVAVGVAVTYEGVKYVWTSRRDLKLSQAIALKKAEIAAEESSRYYHSLAEPATAVSSEPFRTR